MRGRCSVGRTDLPVEISQLRTRGSPELASPWNFGHLDRNETVRARLHGRSRHLWFLGLPFRGEGPPDNPGSVPTVKTVAAVMFSLHPSFRKHRTATQPLLVLAKPAVHTNANHSRRHPGGPWRGAAANNKLLLLLHSHAMGPSTACWLHCCCCCLAAAAAVPHRRSFLACARVYARMAAAQ